MIYFTPRQNKTSGLLKGISTWIWVIGGLIISVLVFTLFFKILTNIITEKQIQTSKESFHMIVNNINTLCDMNAGQSTTKTLSFFDIVDEIYASTGEIPTIKRSPSHGMFLCMNISDSMNCQRLECPIEIENIKIEETVLGLVDKLVGRHGYREYHLKFDRVKCDNKITCCGVNCKNVTDRFHDNSTEKSLIFLDTTSNSEAKIKIPKDYDIRSSKLTISKYVIAPESYIFIANSQEDTVSKLRTSDGVEVCKYPVGDNPSRTAVSINMEVWVANRNSNDVTKLNGSTCDVIGTYPVGKGPRGVAIDFEGNVWIGNAGNNNVMKLDSETGHILGTYPVGDFPYGALTDFNGNIWIVNRKEDSLTKIRASDGYVLDTYSIPGSNPYGIGLDGDGNIWLAGYKPGNIYKIDSETGKVIGTYHIGGGPRGLAVDNKNNVWVADSKRNLIHKINPNGKLLGSFAVGSHPVGMAIDFDGYVWVVNKGSDNVMKINPSDGSIVGTYGVGRGPYTYSDMTGYNLRRVSFDLELDVGDDGIIEWKKHGSGTEAKIFDYNTNPQLREKLMGLVRTCDCSGCGDDGSGNCIVDLKFISNKNAEYLATNLCVCAGTCDLYENPCVRIKKV